VTSAHDLVAAFPRERTWLLPALHAVQEALGWLPEDALREVAAHLRVPASEVYGVASGYPEFRLAAPGRHLVRVCTGVSCRLTGGDALAAALAAKFPDPAAVTVEPADCFFECSMAPLLEVDGAYRGRVRAGDLDGLLAAPAAGHGAEAPAPRERHRFDPAVSATTALAGLVRGAALRRRLAPPQRIMVGAGACGRAVGAGALLDALRAAVAARGLHAEVVDGACNGMCYAAPLVTICCGGWPAPACSSRPSSRLNV